MPGTKPRNQGAQKMSKKKKKTNAKKRTNNLTKQMNNTRAYLIQLQKVKDKEKS